MKVGLRDFIAFPFSVIGFIFIMLAIHIGTEWTSLQIIKFKK